MVGLTCLLHFNLIIFIKNFHLKEGFTHFILSDLYELNNKYYIRVTQTDQVKSFLLL